MFRTAGDLYLKNSIGIILFVFALLLGACGRVAPGEIPEATVEEQAVIPTTPSLAPATLPGTATAGVTPQLFTAIPSGTPPAVLTTATPSQTHSLSPTPDPYAGLTIDALVSRSYGGGLVEAREILAENSYFTRMLISYPSDGLTIYGFMDVPKGGEPPFPVIIALHGYIDPGIYDTIDYTTRYADDLARAGFLVLHPNLRGYPPSDSGENLFRVGMAIDVLNLIAILQDTGGQPGALEQADPEAIGLWGHSMGGGISTRVITVNPDVRAAVLYGAMSGDEQKNFDRIYHYFSSGTRGLEERAVPAEAVERISPVNYLDRIDAAVSIHHGKNDPDVPLAWSLDLCQQLKSLGKTVECFTYPGQAHTFHGDGDVLFIQRTIDFFNRHLRSP